MKKIYFNLLLLFCYAFSLYAQDNQTELVTNKIEV